MASRTFSLAHGSPRELDFVSYGRRGPGHPARFSPEQVAQIARTVRRTPEVLVKVSGGGTSPGKVTAHFRYISRKGELEIETDDGERLAGEGAADRFVDDWDLDLDVIEDRMQHAERGGRTPTPKLVHNLVLSMPAGTAPDRLLAASRDFAREEFALQHRYALVLHTDQDHPHVHLVVRAHRQDGEGRLNIRKPDLRRYREQFARQLRSQGVAANATPAQLRGRLSNHQRDGVYRAALRGESRVEHQRVDDLIAVYKGQRSAPDTGRITNTAKAVHDDWRQTVEALVQQGKGDLATEVNRFVESLRVPMTREQKAIQAARTSRVSREKDLPEVTR